MAYDLYVGQDYEVLQPKCRLVRAKGKGVFSMVSWETETFDLPVGAVITFVGRRKSPLCGSVPMNFFLIESSGRGEDAGSDMGDVVSFEGYFEPNFYGSVVFGYLKEWEV